VKRDNEMTKVFTEGHTLKFMGYTCGDVDYAIESIPNQTIEKTEEVFGNINDNVAKSLDELQRIICGEFCLIDEQEEKLDKLIEITKDEIHGVVNDGIDDIDMTVNSESGWAIGYIKENVTYVWREQSIEMMNYAYDCGIERHEEIAKKRNWQRDMGYKNPDLVYGKDYVAYPDGRVELI
jgi:hypothetical protein